MSRKFTLLDCYKNRLNFQQATNDIQLQKDAKAIVSECLRSVSPKSVIEFSAKNDILLSAFAEFGVNAHMMNIASFPKIKMSNRIICEDSNQILISNSWYKNSHFDVGIALNIIPYLDKETAELFLKRMCACCDTVLISLDTSITQETINICSIEYLSTLLYKFGFVRDISFLSGENELTIYKFSVINDRKKDLTDTIQNYENAIEKESLLNEIELRQTKKENKKTDDLSQKISELEYKLNNISNNNRTLQATNQKKDEEIAKLKKAYEYALKNGYVPPEHKSEEGEEPCVYIVGKDPLLPTIKKSFTGESLDIAWFMPSKKALEQRKMSEGIVNISFSILSVIEDIKDKELTEMLDSVVNQTYIYWDLHIVYISTEASQNTEKILSDYQNRYGNIFYSKAEKGLCVSDYLSKAMENAKGNYISLLSGGDILHPAALFETMQAVKRYSADLIYTDEASFKYSVISIDDEFFKPEFSMQALESFNFINHFSSFSRKLLLDSGEFNSSCETESYHDLMLRLSEHAEKIHHIQEVLYYKRKKGTKKAVDATVAISNHLSRMGYSSKSINRISQDIYSIDYKLTDKPKVSIIITNIGDKGNLKMCVDSIISNTDYDNYEIIVVDNGYVSEDDLIFDKQFSKDMIHCEQLFEKYDVLRDETSLLTKYNKRFSEKELKLFNETMDAVKKRRSTTNDNIISDLKDKYKIKYYSWDGKYNKSCMNNFGANEASGDYLVFIDSQVTACNREWLENLIYPLEDSKVGVSAPEIIFSTGKVDSLGYTHSTKKMFRALFHGEAVGSNGYFNGLLYPMVSSAVQGLCLAVRKKDFVDIGFFSESCPVTFPAFDLSLRFREKGYYNLNMPNARFENHTMYLTERIKFVSANTDEMKETKKFLSEWGGILNNEDPYYNKNFTIFGKTFEKKMSDDTRKNLCLKILEE